MSRAAIAILSTPNLIHNLSVIQSWAPNSGVLAMIKANAYGHGLRSTALRLSRHVRSLGVASIDEALALRQAGIKTSITLMEGAFEVDDLLLASCHGFEVVFHHHEQLLWLRHSSLPLPLKGWIKVDTGMGRLGFTQHEMPGAYEELSASTQIDQPIGIMSHFGCAEDKTHPLNAHQIKQFNEMTQTMPGLKSFSNSAAMLNFPEANYDVVRSGLALYGVSPIPGKMAPDLGLKPVMTLQTRLIAIKKMLKGDSIGYGARYTCAEDMLVGIIAMGYGDGYPRSAQDGMPTLVAEQRCPLVGRVSMDMAVIDLRKAPEAKVNDSVVLWGTGLPVEEIASYTSNSTYDILCGIQARVKFHWTMDLS
ncbi:MAG: alanine racemase [Alphaproteobacteria bacterium]|nr:alanine racemase [Alphaproteobacteria bacterium]OJV45431.1 MAG: alanine racemase [Alphaproteobacteria bacterium 43-37]